MKWEKQGLLFEPPADLAWMCTHAALPFAEQVGDHHRVYFSGRDEKGRAHVGSFTVDLDDPTKILSLGEEPLISPGPLGAFDDSGVTSSWVVDHADRKHQYYSGWSLGVTVPFYLSIGLAVSDDGGASYTKASSAPVLGRTAEDPFLTASPCVIVEGGVWRMWYVSGSKWEEAGEGPKHYYHIKYAESSDGVRWDPKGIVCIDYERPGEHAFSRPCVVRLDDRYGMWYSFRGDTYRIGYAESQDGLQWERRDEEAGIEPSSTGWDSEMIEYPYVFLHEGRRYMLYNGNGFGRTGIGLAVLAQERV